MQHTYTLLDAGDFRKLEQVGPYRIIRPAAAAVWRPQLDASEWQAEFEFQRFSGGDGKWFTHCKKSPEKWPIKFAELDLVMRKTDFGHLGLFAEQGTNWAQIRKLVARQVKQVDAVKVLNLFAYTGGSSLAAAQAGAQVAHVDASKTSVAWARENAEASGLADRPIRWLVDDVQKFVARELRRGAKYQGIILDPPTYGRGANNEVWDIEKHLMGLLDQLKTLLDPDIGFVLLSGHSPGFTPLALANILRQIFAKDQHLLAEEMKITSKTGFGLPSGAYALFSHSEI